MPMHGYTKIELTDVKTGKVETVEKHNIVTNAISDALNKFSRAIEIRRLVHNRGYQYLEGDSCLTAFYGGLLLYDTALGSNPDTLFAPAEAGTVGGANYKYVNTTTLPCLGSYNAAESDLALDKGYATFVYDFATNQANGIIASVCLTSVCGSYLCELSENLHPSRLQNYMISPGTTALAPGMYAITFSSISSTAYVPVFADANKQILVMGRIEATDLEKKLVLNYYDAAPATVDWFDWGTNTAAAKNPRETKTLPLDGLLPETGYNSAYCRLCADAEAEKLYVVVTPGSSIAAGAAIKVREYDLDTMTVQKNYTLPNNTGVSLQGAVSGDAFPTISGLVYEGWLHMWGGGKVYRINLTDPTRVECIEVGSSIDMPILTDAHDGRLYFQDGRENATSSVLNTHTGTQMFNACRHSYGGTYNDKRYAVIPTVGGGAAPAVFERYDTAKNIYCMMRPNYLATINDLDSPVEKTADKTMKITYTLRKGE